MFTLKTDFIDRGDQAQAIAALSRNIQNNVTQQVLLGVTGSGKTYTAARVIERIGLPTLVMSHNKTLTAQLYSEFKSFFPENAVEYFVSYYDYYQPEAYIASSDTYIEKDASINERIERLRLKAAASLLSRKDVIIVASVSCIYGIGEPDEWKEMIVTLENHKVYGRKNLIMDIVAIQYERNDINFTGGTFRVRGGVIDIYPAYIDDEAVRVVLDGDKISGIYTINPLTGKKIADYKKYVIYPATHFVSGRGKLKKALGKIKEELKERLYYFKKNGKLLEAERLKMRTEYDIEMLEETGYCHGIENYSRHISGRIKGIPSACLINYFPDKFLTIIDESHVTIPQLRGMYAGDHSRKKNLVEFGFRLPSALDNRPLKFDEFKKLINSVIYISATPSEYEIEESKGKVVEQIIRPTGLIDPEVEIKPSESAIKDLIIEVTKRVKKKQRVFITTITKRMAEDVAEFLDNKGLRVRYLHSEIDTLKRIEILKNLREGKFDCLVGVNLLREGLDVPEVSLVAILDADKEGFLRSETSLVQVSGRAARNIDGKIIMYADNITGSMTRALKEMARRRKIQTAFNKKHNITPKSIVKAIRTDREFEFQIKKKAVQFVKETGWDYIDKTASAGIIKIMEKDMKEAADLMDFELAAAIRDKINEIKPNLLSNR